MLFFLMGMDEYQSINSLSGKELLGCDPITEFEGNAETLLDRLHLTLALFRTRAIADHVFNQVHREAKRMPVRYHEYVINEMQFEFRLARSWDNDSGVNEDRLLDIYAGWLEKKMTKEEIAKVIKKTRKNRAKRTRVVPPEKS